MIADIKSPKWEMTPEGARFSVIVPPSSAAQLCDEIGENYQMEVKPKRKKRSLDANALMWAVLGDMALILQRTDPKITSDDIYREYIRHTNNYVTAEVAEERFKELERTWQSNGLGWIAERMDWVHRYHESPKWVVRLFYGSSQYDSKQFSALIDSILTDAVAMGIDTTNESFKALIEQYPGGQL